MSDWTRTPNEAVIYITHRLPRPFESAQDGFSQMKHELLRLLLSKVFCELAPDLPGELPQRPVRHAFLDVQSHRREVSNELHDVGEGPGLARDQSSCIALDRHILSRARSAFEKRVPER